MDVRAVMAALLAPLDAIAGVTGYDYPPDAVVTPAAVIGFPDPLQYRAGSPGADGAVFPVHIVLPKQLTDNAADNLGAYMQRSGAKSVFALLEADVTLGGAIDSLRVDSCTTQVLTIGAVEYLAATFNVHVLVS